MGNPPVRFLLGVLSLVSIAGCDSLSKPPIDWSIYLAGEYYKNPSELVKEVDKNEVAFERKYDNRIIYVAGRVKNIDKDSFQITEKYMYWNDLAEMHVKQEASIHCSVRDDSRDLIIELENGAKVVAAGRVDYSGGGILDSIVLDDCIWGNKNNADTIEGAKTDIAWYSYKHAGTLASRLNYKGDHKEALFYVNKKLAFFPSTDLPFYAAQFIYVHRAMIKKDLGDYQGAIADYTKAIDISSRQPGDPYDSQIHVRYFNRGNVKRISGDHQGACADWKKAISFGWEQNKFHHDAVESYEMHCE